MRLNGNGSRLLVSIALFLTLCGCQTSRTATERRGDKTRDIFANATEKLRPTIEWTARKVGAAIGIAAEEALAAVEGVVEGWTRPEHHPEQRPVDLNSANVAELRKLPGITEVQVQSIVRNRPYRSTRELVSRARLPEDVYAKIRDRVSVD